MCAVSWASDELILPATVQGSFQHWDVKTGKMLKTFSPLGSNVSLVCGALSPNGKIFGVGGLHPYLDLIHVETGGILQHLEGHANTVLGLAWLGNGSELLTASADDTIRLWEASTGRQSGVIEGHTGYVTSISLSSDRASSTTRSSSLSTR